MNELTLFKDYAEIYNPDMIKLARESRGLTQKELCEKMGIHQGTVSKIENRTLSFDKDAAIRFSEALDYPTKFFEKKIAEFATSVIYFRRKQSLPKRIMYMIEARMNIIRDGIEHLLSSVEAPDVEVVKWNVEAHGEPEKAAQSLRELWRVPKGPITKLIRLIENKGIIVVSFDFETDLIDGLSMYTQSLTPVICYNSHLKGDRRRLTIAHELGHLVMHIGQVVSEVRDVEGEAFSFATEFLVPEAEFAKSFIRLDLATLASLKEYWQISMRAMIYKSEKRNLISSNQAKYLWKQMAVNNYIKNEPVNIYSEQPSMLKEIIEFHLKELGYEMNEIADFVGIELKEFKQIYLLEEPRFKITRNVSLSA